MGYLAVNKLQPVTPLLGKYDRSSYRVGHRSST